MDKIVCYSDHGLINEHYQHLNTRQFSYGEFGDMYEC